MLAKRDTRLAKSERVGKLGLSGGMRQRRVFRVHETVGSNPTVLTISRGGAVAARKAHNLEVGGSNPPPATKQC